MISSVKLIYSSAGLVEKFMRGFLRGPVWS